MKTFRLLSFSLVSLIGGFLSCNDLSAQDAPETFTGSAVSTAGISINIPVTVQDFTMIGSMYLRLDFNPNQLDFTGYANLYPGIWPPVEVTVNDSLHFIRFSSFWLYGLTLNNGTKLCDLVFTCIEGDPALFFNNESNGGNDCEYASKEGLRLNDVPTPLFYHHGQVHIIPENRHIQNISVPSGETACFDALETISAGGSGTFFQVQNGGDVTLVAGEHVFLLPGTKIFAGAHLEAYISAGPYCMLPGSSPYNPSGEPVTDPPAGKITSSSGLAIYPNPTDGIFTLQFSDGIIESGCSVIICNSTGRPVHSQSLGNSVSYRFSLSNQPAGIYFVRIISAGNSEVLKILKY
jgi:hypothetical protein